MAQKFSEISKAIDERLDTLTSGRNPFSTLVGELVDMWRDIQDEKQKAESYHPIRMDLEREMLHFTIKVKLAYRFIKDTPSEPEWMRRGYAESGRKAMGSFFDTFFREMRTCNPEVVTLVEDRFGHPVSYYKKRFVRWRILRRYESEAGKKVRGCILRARRLRVVVDGLGELGSV